MTYIQRSQSQELQFQSQKAAAQVKILQDPLAGGERLFSAKWTQILQGISTRKSFALPLKLRQRQPFTEIEMLYVVVLFSDYSMGLRSIFSIRTCPYFWCFKHLMGGASNPTNTGYNPEKNDLAYSILVFHWTQICHDKSPLSSKILSGSPCMKIENYWLYWIFNDSLYQILTVLVLLLLS